MANNDFVLEPVEDNEFELEEVEAPKRSVRDLLVGGNLLKDTSIEQRSLGSDVASTAAGVVEGFTGGLSRLASPKIEDFLGKRGIDVDIPEGNIIGNIGGFILGPGKFIRGATKGLQTLTKAGPVLRGATEGALGGFIAPTQRGKELDIGERTGQSIIGAGLGAIAEPLISLTGSLIKFNQAGKALNQLRHNKKKITIDAERRINDLGRRQDVIRDANTKIVENQKKILEQARKELPLQSKQ